MSSPWISALRSVALEVPDLAQAEDFYTRVWHLAVAERGAQAIYLRGTGAAAMQGQQVVVGAGAAQVDRLRAALGHGQVPDPRVEVLGLGQVGHFERHAAQCADPGGTHAGASGKGR